jgi:twinkle protein
METKAADLLRGSYLAIPNRRLDEETCRLFDYQIAEVNGEKCHVANYRDRSGNVTAQKVRKAGKEFSWRGEPKSAGLFGDHLWSKGKRIVITEGEIDALSVSQAMGNKWPVVSLKDGAQSAVKSIQKSYEYLDGFEEVVLMFDQDEHGREAAAACAEILPVGKVKIATLPLKDANECLVAGKVDAIVQAMWNAKPFRPDGIVMAKDLKEVVLAPDVEIVQPYPFKRLTEITKGIRPAELVVITSGSGMGKTTFVREIAYSLHQAGKKVGLLMLEESNKRTLRGLVGLHINKNILVDPEMAEEPEVSKAFDELFQDQDIALFDHFGSTDVDNIANRIRFMARGLGCTHVVLDHISILVSGLATGDERKLIDIAMTKLRTLVQETGISLFIISHLKRPEGNQGHEDGAKVHLGQLRGSHAIAQLADVCIAIQKTSDDEGVDMTELRVLKNRFTGETGGAGTLHYDRQTGRLTESIF